MITLDAASRIDAASSALAERTGRCSVFAWAVWICPNAPNSTLANERFIALHMMMERIRPLLGLRVGRLDLSERAEQHAGERAVHRLAHDDGENQAAARSSRGPSGSVRTRRTARWRTSGSSPCT